MKIQETLGEGAERETQWILLKTDKGKVAYIEEFVGPDVNWEASFEWDPTETEVDDLVFEVGHWWGKGGGVIPEPSQYSYVHHG